MSEIAIKSKLDKKPEQADKKPYKVLARKYRPKNFDELVGQDALVRTLKNAIESGRIAHAYMLTGIRGTGKTTTARIIAKALNYKGADGSGDPTIGPTDDCTICQAITEDRHPDVLEMDAASRTGVDDIREILDGVRYAPTSARYKVYIIDEVHMLSKAAFNALLKTLEEPPAHVIFIFATTEIRKVPVTVLSRCQRFDLRRIDAGVLAGYYQEICDKEGVEANPDAVAMIARAADGSARDGLSLLDRAITLSGGVISTDIVQDMLGLADRAQTLDLLHKALQGDAPEALGVMDDLYEAGGDALIIMQDLLGLTHQLTRVKVAPHVAGMDKMMPENEVARIKEIAAGVSMPALGKAWQILLKGIKEVQDAAHPQAAAEMVIIRLIYAANLPDPADLIKTLKDGGSIGSDSGGSDIGGAPSQSGGNGNNGPGGRARMRVHQGGGSSSQASAVQTAPSPIAETAQVEQAQAVVLDTLQDVVQLLEEHDEILIASQVRQFVHLIRMKDGHIEINIEEQAHPRLAQDLSARLSALTGRHWMVSVTRVGGAPTLAEQHNAARQAEMEEVRAMPIMQDIFKAFPDAELVDIKHHKNNTDNQE